MNDLHPFLRSVGLASGISEHRLDGPSCRRLFRSVRVSADAPLTPMLRARAALLVAGPGAVVSHHTAAEVLGGVVPRHHDTHVTVPSAKRRPKTSGIRAHVAPGGIDVHAVADVPLTTAPQTFVDLARSLELVDLVVLGDSPVRQRRCTPEDLRFAASQFRGRGGSLARHAAHLVRAEVDSAMESRSRLLLVLAGLPEPTVNVKVLDEGRVVYRIDLGFASIRVGLEYEGRHHADDPRQWAHDIRRREYLAARDWRLLTLTSGDIFRTPRATLHRVVDLLSSRGMDVSMPVPGAEWERHFPGM
ncbi:hypothetical protein [Ornithinimicrobium sediminis]|uniref:hypothetical protein n=1 Tax=Ornithinimicrobium sediminis TaxID=2904603 RepID=UPI001E4BB2D1|nr:hypothetical protein [Ornithinimicrobium sediminis]MCE0486127.1 hypothetical protein [Ornithinimicrobium sediminis]